LIQLKKLFIIFWRIIGGVKALVVKRIYPTVASQLGTLPLIVYQQISGRREHTMTESVGLVESRYQVDCWATTYTGAQALAKTVRVALDNHSGTTGTVKIEVIHLINEMDGIANIADAKIARRYRRLLEFIIWFQE